MTQDELLALVSSKSNHPFMTLKYNEQGQLEVQQLVRALRAAIKVPTYAEQGISRRQMDFEMEMQDHGILQVRNAIERELTSESANLQ